MEPTDSKLTFIKGKLTALALCAIFAVPATAQNNNFSFRDRLFFGGGFGLSIGDYTDIEVSPIAGYYITSRWAAGVGISYKYFNYKYRWPTPAGGWERYETHIYGGSLFTNYVIVHNVNDWIPLGLDFRIFAHAEYEALSYAKGLFEQHATGRQIQSSVLVGGGLRFPMGKRSSMNLTLLWNLNSSVNDIYGSGPIIRFGFNF
jgi:hypothetical protein